jgi:hypothetical protein
MGDQGATLEKLRRSAPHPTPPGLFRGPTYSGHYYQGVDYSGTNQLVSKLSVTLRIPSDAPESSDFYYVILSTWDDASSYDQIGFSNDFGIWGLTYSYTSPCAGTYYYNPAVMGLDQGASYTFSMSIATGNVTFAAVDSNASVVWNQTYFTGGSNFYEAGSITCNAGTAFAYTDYEEVYTTNAPEPPYNFVFQDNLAAGAEVNAWSNFSANSTQPINVAISSNQVAIQNEPYSVAPGGPNHFDLERARTPVFLNESINVSRVLGTGAFVQLSAYYIPATWTASFTPASGTTPYTSRLSLELASNSAFGVDVLGLRASNGTASYARSTITINLFAHVHVVLGTNASRSLADVGQSVTFRATATGGVGPYAYSWSNLPGGCAPPGGNAVACVLNRTGAFPVSVNVTDQLGYSNDSSFALAVGPDPAITGRSFFPPSRTLDVGQTLFVNATVAGGSGGIAYSWSGIAECPGINGPGFVCTVTTTGTSNLTLRITDAAGFGASIDQSINVSSDPVLSAPTLGRSHVDLGQPTTITINASGGSGGDILQWQGLPPGCAGSTVSLVCAPSAPGNYSIAASIVDSNHFHANSGRAKFSVSPVPTVSLTPANATLLLGDVLSIAVLTSGGYGALTFRWSGLPLGCTAPTGAALSCTPNATGSFPLTVRVTDANGISANASALVTVQTPPAGPPHSLSASSLLPYVLLPVAVVAALVVFLIAYRRRRRSADTGPAESDEERASPGGAVPAADERDVND